MSIDDPNAPRRVSALHLDLARRRRATDAAIKDGQLPSLAELYTGCGFAGADWKLDLRLWCRDLLLDKKLEIHHDRIRHLHDTCSVPALFDCREAMENESCEIFERIDFYLAANQNRDARRRVACVALDSHFGRPDHRRVAFGIGVARSSVTILKPHLEIKSTEIIIKSAAADIQMAEEAGGMLDSGGVVQSAEDQLQDLLALVGEDRAEIDFDDDPAPVEGLVVVPVLPPATGFKLTINKGWAGIAGERLPLIKAPDPVQAVEAFRTAMPHAVDEFIKILGSMQEGQPLRLAPVLLVGGAGTGKTTTARTIAEILGLPVEVHGMAGASDSSVMGTSAQWGSARENDVLHHIRLSRVANPLMVWDEIEKIGTNRHNGNAAEALLPLLEQHTAKRFRDPALEVEVDLSMVSHIATANSLEGIPKPLLDRFRVIRMPEPTWQHVGALSRNILNRIAEERSLDRRWFPDFAGDELAVIERNWTGGSIRRLERIIRILVDGRDKLLGQA